MEKIERIPCGNGNCYIISNGENAILVDTYRKEYREKILNACKPYKMRLLVLTHGHMDHVQNAAFLSEKLQIPIAMCREDADLIKDNMLQPLKAQSIMGKIVLAVSVKSFRKDMIPFFAPDIWLSEGDSLDDYGISAKIMLLPGHTNGSLAIDVAEKYLIVGDALMNMFYPSVSLLYHDKEVMLKSAEKISKLGERVIYFGHGKPLSNRTWVKEKN